MGITLWNERGNTHPEGDSGDERVYPRLWVGSRLDEEKLEMLRSWGDGLSQDPRDEVRAAGRAILMLIEEVEHLHVDLWHAKEPEPVDLVQAQDTEPEPEPEPTIDATAARSLRNSIARLRGRESPTAPA